MHEGTQTIPMSTPSAMGTITSSSFHAMANANSTITHRVPSTSIGPNAGCMCASRNGVLRPRNVLIFFAKRANIFFPAGGFKI